MRNLTNIKNKKATFEFEVLDVYNAGIMLTGTEIKSLRKGKASLSDAYCSFIGDELWVKNLHIAEYSHGTYSNHEPKRERKLLLNRIELNKLQKKIKEKGLSIIPLRFFINENGFAKLDIGLAKGKKMYDKRQDMKSKDAKREIDRMKKL